MHSVLPEISQADAHIFKKKIAKLQQFKGRGTELISVYIPPQTDRGSVMGQLNEELSQSSNIKSPQTRKNVQAALRKISNFLKQINFKIPDTGLAVFSGNISENEGKTDIRLFTIKPIKELRTKLYWCDSTFHLEPLQEMSAPQEIYGLITIDKNEATISILIGKRYEIIGKFTSGVAGKARAGGQCLSSDTLITLSNGDIVEIKTTHNPLPILSADFKNIHTTETIITDKWETEKKPITIVTKYPRFEIQSSKDHTFFVFEKGKIKEKQADTLSIKDQLLFPEKLNIKGKTQKLQTHFFNSYTLPNSLDYNLAQIIGYWLGDGNTEKERVCFSEKDPQVANFYVLTIKKTLNASVKIRHRAKKGYYQIRAYGKPIVKFLQSEFPEKHTAKDSQIPKKILRSPNEVVAGFLKGLFDAEGYISSNRIGLGVNNKKLIKQLQIVLLRFGIISSMQEYDNQKKPYTKNHKFTLQISEKQSIETFQKKIGFSSDKKSQKLKKATKSLFGKNNVRQVLALGSDVRKIIEKHGWKKQHFIEANMFLQNKRKISKQAFQRSIIEKAKTNPKLQKTLKKFLEIEFLPVEIAKIQKGKKPISMTDISVQNQNFLAQSLIVHNSAKRFEHLREEAAQDFYKRISEKTNTAFLPLEEKLKGIIVGGPGITKNFFLEKELIDYRLKKKVIGTIDISYTDESGIRELIQRSDELLKNTALIKEQKLLFRFLEQIAKNALASYGEKKVLADIKIGKVDTVLVSEGINWPVFKFICTSCNTQTTHIAKTPAFNPNKEKCPQCASTELELTEEIDYFDYIIEQANATGAKVEIISTDTQEGQQFLKSFEGIGALLRYQ